MRSGSGWSGEKRSSMALLDVRRGDEPSALLSGVIGFADHIGDLTETGRGLF
jgi:hypothetical protein